jgi:sensor histidine kinase regulating citrate/malate metabolism
MNPFNKIFLGMGALIALAVAVVFIWLSLANAHLKVDLAQEQENDTACRLANDQFVTQVAQQNKAVERLKTESIAREKHAQALAEQAQKNARASFLVAEKLRKTKEHGDACRSSETIFNQYLGANR